MVGIASAVEVSVGGRGVEVAVGKGVMAGAGMNSGVQAARTRVSKMVSSCPGFMVPFTV